MLCVFFIRNSIAKCLLRFCDLNLKIFQSFDFLLLNLNLIIFNFIFDKVIDIFISMMSNMSSNYTYVEPPTREWVIWLMSEIHISFVFYVVLIAGILSKHVTFLSFNGYIYIYIVIVICIYYIYVCVCL